MTEPPPAPVDRASDKETARLEAFSDGVLAVIITITAFGLRSAGASARLAAVSRRCTPSARSLPRPGSRRPHCTATSPPSRPRRTG